MNRGFWFVAGAGAGVWAVARVRRVAEAFTPAGLGDRIHGLALGAHLFAEEVRTGMSEKETELRERLGLALDGSRELESAGARQLDPHRPTHPAPPVHEEDPR